MSFDDPLYVTGNLHVRNGFTRQGLTWAVAGNHGGNWQPLTILSHMLDGQLFGTAAWGHHLTNVLLHAANAVLLFGALRTMTGATWPSALAAALFAVHPLHVESVAWVSGRKDLVSTLFGLLAVWAYVAYARRGTTVAYAWCAIFLTVGLLAKPMLVTLPVLFLLLDYWPLRRTVALATRSRAPSGGAGAAHGRTSSGPAGDATLWRLVAEKVPLAALALAAGILTLVLQRLAGTTEHAGAVPLVPRIANAVVSYVRYLGKTFRPTDLAVLYPHPNLPGGTPWRWWEIGGAAAVLFVISVAAIRLRHWPHLVVGWLWFLVSLLPVIGIVQVGRQAMADRYTYLPLIGVYVAIAWSAADLVAARPQAKRLRAAVAATAALALAVCGGLAHEQARHWRDSRALYERAVAVAPGSAVMHNNLGIALAAEGETAAAIAHYRRAVALNPDFPNAHNNLANALQRRGDLDEAVAHYRRALEIEPGYASAHSNIGMALRAQGKLDEAIAHLTRAVELNPRSADAHNNLGLVLLARERIAEAISHFRAAMAAAPDDPLPRQNLAYALRLRDAGGRAAETSSAASRGED